MNRPMTVTMNTGMLVFLVIFVFISELRAQSTMQIEVNTVTSDRSGAETDASIYLGMGGREFRLDTPTKTFEQSQADTFIFGEQSNVVHPEGNDPRVAPPLTPDDIDRFPVYVRMSDVGDQNNPSNFPADEWIVDDILVTVSEGGPVIRSFSSPRLGVANDGITQLLGPRSGFVLYLTQCWSGALECSVGGGGLVFDCFDNPTEAACQECLKSSADQCKRQSTDGEQGIVTHVGKCSPCR